MRLYTRYMTESTSCGRLAITVLKSRLRRPATFCFQCTTEAAVTRPNPWPHHVASVGFVIVMCVPAQSWAENPPNAHRASSCEMLHRRHPIAWNRRYRLYRHARGDGAECVQNPGMV